MNSWLGRSKFVGVFVIFKGAVFLAPLLLAQVLSDPQKYGEFEYVMGFATVCTPLLMSGMSGAYPYFALKHAGSQRYGSVVFTHLIGVGLIGTLAFSVWSYVGVGLLQLLGIGISAVLGLQYLIAIIAKTHTHPGRAVVFESGLYVAVLGSCVMGWYTSLDPLNTLWVASTLYLVGLTLFGSLRRYGSPKASASEIKEVYKYSSKLIITTVLVLLLVRAAPLSLEYFLGLEAVGTYGLYFRIVSAVILLHQMFVTYYFKDIYSLELSTIDNITSRALIVMALCSAAIFLIGFPVAARIMDTVSGYTNDSALIILLSFHVLLWAVHSWNELIIYRQNLASKMIKSLSIVVGLYIASLFIISFKSITSILLISAISTIALFISVLWQYIIISRNTDSGFLKTRKVLIILSALTGFVIIVIT